MNRSQHLPVLPAIAGSPGSSVLAHAAGTGRPRRNGLAASPRWTGVPRNNDTWSPSPRSGTSTAKVTSPGAILRRVKFPPPADTSTSPGSGSAITPPVKGPLLRVPHLDPKPVRLSILGSSAAPISSDGGTTFSTRRRETTLTPCSSAVQIKRTASEPPHVRRASPHPLTIQRRDRAATPTRDAIQKRVYTPHGYLSSSRQSGTAPWPPESRQDRRHARARDWCSSTVSSLFGGRGVASHPVISSPCSSTLATSRSSVSSVRASSSRSPSSSARISYWRTVDRQSRRPRSPARPVLVLSSLTPSQTLSDVGHSATRLD